MTEIKRALPYDVPTVAELACELWEDNTIADMTENIAADMSTDRNAYFLAYDGETPVGFCHASLRRDYVEGSDTSPVGYLEGVYVRAAYRRKGIARQMLRAAEGWAAERGCTEFASDRELNNAESEAFHLGAGFNEANRIVAYIKQISTTATPREPQFWLSLDNLIENSEIIIDRPAGIAHPRYPDFIYPLDYGYLENTSAMDGGGIDLWRGSLPKPTLDAVFITVDLTKRDSEIKLILGCTETETATAFATHNENGMSAIRINRKDYICQ